MHCPYKEGFFGVFKPRPRLLPSEWAERYRELPSDGSAEPGRWRNSRTPYLVEIMDSLSAHSRAKEVVFCKGSQIGATEAGLNWLMYLIDQTPGPILAFQPTDDNAKDWSLQRVGPSLERCGRIREKIRPAKSRTSGNTLFEKAFDGGVLFLSGTNTPNALASKPVGNLYFDEIDRYPLIVGGEGNPIDLALRRIATFPRAKVFYSSTPVLKETSRIWDLYLKSDRRVYEIPCPHCGCFQVLEFENLKWERGCPEGAEYVCGGCGCFIAESHKTEMLAKGRWRATNPGHWRPGFHLSALYSPIGWLSWGDIAKTREEAEGDSGKMQVFFNTILGLPWEEDSETIASDFLMRRVERYGAEVPDGVLALTLAVDVQGDRLECEVRGWGESEESWGIRYRVIRGVVGELKSNDPENPTVWEILDDFRKTRFLRTDGGDIGVSITLIDSGGNYTDTVYSYTRMREKERVYSIKGGSQPSRPLLNKAIRAGKCRALLFVLGVDKGKDLAFSRLKIEKPGPGYCHFPDGETGGYDSAYYAGLIGERRVIKRKNGKRIHVWELQKGARNEPFDLAVYGTAAIRILSPKWERLKEQRGQRQNRQRPPAAAAAPRIVNLGQPPPAPIRSQTAAIRLYTV